MKNTATKQFKNVTDKELAAKMQTGSSAEKQLAFNELYKRWKDNIYITLFRGLNVAEKNEVAKDLSQNTFVKVFNNIGGFDLTLGAFSTWIYTITHNELIDFKRKQKMEVLNYEGIKNNSGNDDGKELAFQIKCSDKIADEAIIQSQQNAQVQQIIMSAIKSDKMRDIVLLCYYEQMSYEEIAAKLEIPVGTVRSTLSRAKEVLKEYIEEKTSILA